jgi:hypothetical protein
MAIQTFDVATPDPYAAGAGLGGRYGVETPYGVLSRVAKAGPDR